MIHNVIGDYCDWTLDIVNGTLEERKSNHRQAVGCYQTGNVSGPVGKLGRGLVAASNIQTTSTFTFSFKPALSLSHSDQHFLTFYSL